MNKSTLLASIAFLVVVVFGFFCSFGCLENYQNGWFFIVCGLVNLGISGYAGHSIYSHIRAKLDPDDGPKGGNVKKTK
jgi:hypothetical protein